MGPYKNLRVWQQSMNMAMAVYDATSAFPRSEMFGLVSQMRRCVVSIPSNIAEGYGRGSNNDLVHFLYIALGSSNELETQLILSKQFSYITDEDFIRLDALNSDINKMLRSLIFVRQRNASAPVNREPAITSEP